MKKFLLIAAIAATLAAPGAAHAKRYNLILAFGSDVLIAGDEDDVAIRAQCIQNENGGGDDVVRIYAEVGQNSVMRGYDIFTGNGSYVTAATPPSNAEIAYFGQTTGNEYFGGNIDAGFVLNLTSMRGFVYTSESTILGVNSGGDDCIVSINLDAIKKFKAAE